jgi:hypothetical protein
VLPAAFFRKRGRWVLIALLAIVICGITSCAGAGGGGGGAPPSSGTPAGTYSIALTANANGISHKLTLTLTVK